MSVTTLPTEQPQAESLGSLLVRHLVRALLLFVLAIVLFYALLSYGVLPQIWRYYESRHPALSLAPTRAFTSLGIPGDPINLAFIGSRDNLIATAGSAGWTPADPITWSSSTRIVVDSLTHRAYTSAPVSDLFVHGKRQDLAFEKPFGPDPSKRHHVRFWQSDEVDALGRALWLGAATFDSSAGVSHRTGQVTHHIDADVDRERDTLIADWTADEKTVAQWVQDFQKEHQGKNGGGDAFFTDGRLCLLVQVHYGMLDSAQVTAGAFVAFLGESLSK
jgi:hypothetical protein